MSRSGVIAKYNSISIFKKEDIAKYNQRMGFYCPPVQEFQSDSI
jgi:hypothetical protein